MTTLVHLKLGTLRGPLSLERAPIYLRFVLQGTDWKTLDALDQPDDLPTEGEKIYAAKKRDSSSVHVDGVRNGKRFGEWHKTATYELVPEQPEQSVMADRQQWATWCEKQISETAPAAHSPPGEMETT